VAGDDARGQARARRLGREVGGDRRRAELAGTHVVELSGWVTRSAVIAGAAELAGVLVVKLGGWLPGRPRSPGAPSSPAPTFKALYSGTVNCSVIVTAQRKSLRSPRSTLIASGATQRDHGTLLSTLSPRHVAAITVK
jgi:hypothetical protein